MYRHEGEGKLQRRMEPLGAADARHDGARLVDVRVIEPGCGFLLVWKAREPLDGDGGVAHERLLGVLAALRNRRHIGEEEPTPEPKDEGTPQPKPEPKQPAKASAEKMPNTGDSTPSSALGVSLLLAGVIATVAGVKIAKRR